MIMQGMIGTNMHLSFIQFNEIATEKQKKSNCEHD